MLPHLLVPRLPRGAADGHPGARGVVLNLEPQAGETDDFSPEQQHLRVLHDHLQGVPLHTVVADESSVV